VGVGGGCCCAWRLLLLQQACALADRLQFPAGAARSPECRFMRCCGCSPRPVPHLRGEGRDEGVHAVLHVEHLDRVARGLQPLEQAGVVAVLRGAAADDGGGQLLGVTHQEGLQQGCQSVCVGGWRVELGGECRCVCGYSLHTFYLQHALVCWP
jgi:hypothetical protein